jgi:hypothetical protein
MIDHVGGVRSNVDRFRDTRKRFEKEAGVNCSIHVST